MLLWSVNANAEDWTSIGEPDCSPTTECVYINSAAGGGSGTSWSDALSTWPSSYTRGKKYYVADGSYAGDTFNTAVSGSTYIFIKKATASDHGTETGWSSAYGDGVAVITGFMDFEDTSGYWVFDGQVGGGPDDWYGETTPYGFRIDYASGYRVRVGGSSWPSPTPYLNLYHIMWNTGGAGSDAIVGKLSYSTISHCYFYQSNRTSFLFQSDSTNNTIEYNSFRDHNCTSGQHNEPVSWNDSGDNSNNIIRYNEFWNWKGDTYGATGVIVMKGDTTGVTTGDFQIYGNIFRCTTGYGCEVSNGIITDTDSSAGTASDIKVWGNTFYNTGSVSMSALIRYGHPGSGNEFRNNIVIDADHYGASGTETHNLYDNSEAASGDSSGGQYYTGAYTDLFNDPDNNDFTLKIATDAGYDLSENYTVDMLGVTFGDDGIWDRGAYEYASGAAPTNSIQGVTIN